MVDFKKLNTPEFKERIAERKEQERIEEELRLKTCAFTGHRPSKLPGKYNWKHSANIELGLAIREQVEKLVERGVDRFICGGALGVDQMAFAVCQKLKQTKYDHLYLILAMPFLHQDANWPNQQDRTRLLQQRESANEVVLVDKLGHWKYRVDTAPDIYHPEKMQRRNEYMIDHSAFLVAVWDGTHGGTGNCVRYAQRNMLGNMELISIEPNTLRVDVRYF